MSSKMVISAIVFFVLFLVLFSLYGFWVAVHPPKYKTDIIPKDLGFDYKEVVLTTGDNLKISAWYVPSKIVSNKVIVVLHGYPFDKANIISWASFLHDEFNLFFFDFRYFGESEGSITTVGYREQKDLKSAIDYLEKRKFSKIGAMGFSLGGAVATMTAANDKRIKAVVSDSAFANLDLMADEYYQNLSIFKYPLSLLTKIWAKIFVGVYPSDVSPEEAAEKLQIPILVIHSKKDQVIPFENAIRIKNALKNNPQAEFLFQEEGIHGGLLENQRQEYQEKIVEFFKENL